jgi:N,N'-diacetylchitobiose transport system substrate-binding protein
VVGVTSKSKNKSLATEWTRIFTGTSSQELLVAKNALPNTTALLDKAAAQKGNEATAQAAKVSWFTPVAPKWADVEKANVITQLLTDIATGNKSVADAAKAADADITRILNG